MQKSYFTEFFGVCYHDLTHTWLPKAAAKKCHFKADNPKF